MSEPIRSASVSPFATARPQVHSRRVSLRVGAFGLTYSTDRLLWNADPPPVDPAPAVESERQPDPQPEKSTFPQDLETARRQAQQWAYAQEQAARQQTLEGQAHGQQTGAQQADESQVAGQPVGEQNIGGQDVVGPTAQAAQQPGAGPVAGSQGKPDPSQKDAALVGQTQTRRSTDTISPGADMAGVTLPGEISGGARTDDARANSADARPGQSRAERALAQAMRQATQAYRACQASFACPRPMLQAIA
ncbi:MAG: hypothetical protein A2051_03470 [Desulfovibrionales bacterium GWA2_65_9]|nr:MAG: hypothetical protein A2051_03470 [Desulfovibrionales bacterium GWA2_65_9]